jgi:predicted DNA-binding transcriptional regulator AlpA
MRSSDERGVMDMLLTEAQTAAVLGVAERTLQWWRKAGTSPPYTRLSARSIRYPRNDLLAWLAARGRSASPPASATECAPAAREEPDG